MKTLIAVLVCFASLSALPAFATDLTTFAGMKVLECSKPASSSEPAIALSIYADLDLILGGAASGDGISVFDTQSDAGSRSSTALGTTFSAKNGKFEFKISKLGTLSASLETLNQTGVTLNAPAPSGERVSLTCNGMIR